MDVNVNMVYQVPMQDTDLKRHFKDFLGCFCKENSGRFISGILSPSVNARIGTSEALEEDIQFFRSQNVPFCWYVEEKSDPQFKQKLLALGFHDLGVFQGMSNRLEHSFKVDLKDECTVELVQDQSLMNEFTSLVCPVFGITADAADQYKQVLWEEPKVYNWVLKKDGAVVAGLSSFIDGPVVSIWNVATHPAFRRQGYCHELWKVALNQAISKGCRTGMTYLTSEGMAMGICQRLGYQTKWWFHAYLCPSESSSQ